MHLTSLDRSIGGHIVGISLKDGQVALRRRIIENQDCDMTRGSAHQLLLLLSHRVDEAGSALHAASPVNSLTELTYRCLHASLSTTLQ